MTFRNVFQHTWIIVPSEKKYLPLGRQNDVVTGKPNQLSLLSFLETDSTRVSQELSKYLSSRSSLMPKHQLWFWSFVYFQFLKFTFPCKRKTLWLPDSYAYWCEDAMEAPSEAQVWLAVTSRGFQCPTEWESLKAASQTQNVTKFFIKAISVNCDKQHVHIVRTPVTWKCRRSFSYMKSKELVTTFLCFHTSDKESNGLSFLALWCWIPMCHWTRKGVNAEDGGNYTSSSKCLCLSEVTKAIDLFHS